MPEHSQDVLQEGVVRKVLKSDIGILITVVGIIFTFFRMVILPIQEIQLKLTQIEISVADFKGQVAKHEHDITILKEREGIYK